MSLGHIAIMMPDKFPVHIKNLVSRNLVKQLLMKGASEPHDIEEPWVNYDKLPMETKCKYQVGLSIIQVGKICIIFYFGKMFRMYYYFRP